MTITLQALLAADTGRMIDVAAHWDRLAQVLDTAVDDLGRGTRDLPHHWPAGPSSQAAQQHGEDLRARLGNAHGHCRAVATVIREFAGEVEDNRRLLHGLVADARTAGLWIDLVSGLITAPIEVAAEEYRRQISEIVARVNDADRRTTDALVTHIYREDDVPSAETPDYDEAAVLALATVPPADRAAWWRAQHPLNQERAIADHPEIIGAAAGLPAQDRDTANRMLLRRAREDLISAREGHGDRVNRAQLTIERRLAAIDDLERRAGGRRLVAYRPGAEQEAELR